MGRSFTFRAQPALDQRQREYDTKRRAVAAAEFELAHEQRRFEEARDTLCEAERDFTRALEAPTTSGTVVWHRDWMTRVEQAVRAHAAALATTAARVTAVRAECQWARQRVDTMERLKDRARDVWVRDEEARERRELDEMATLRYQRPIQAAEQEQLLGGAR